MRIIITQEEIEEAIEKLILDQVEVPEDMRIDIALKATRGDEGYTAEIDIVAFNAPEDGTDRSVDPRIEVVDGAQNLGIAEKVLEAKQQAALPRRRGRPAGARNRPKLSTDHRSTEPKDEVTENQAASEVVSETDPGSEIDPGIDVEVGVENEEKAVQEAQEEAIEPQPVQETAEVEQAPVEAPVEVEVVDEPSEAQEPQDEDVDYTPTPETPGLETSEAETEEKLEPQPETVEASPEVVQPTRSLFANLQRPNNGG